MSNNSNKISSSKRKRMTESVLSRPALKSLKPTQLPSSNKCCNRLKQNSKRPLLIKVSIRTAQRQMAYMVKAEPPKSCQMRPKRRQSSYILLRAPWLATTRACRQQTSNTRSLIAWLASLAMPRPRMTRKKTKPT